MNIVMTETYDIKDGCVKHTHAVKTTELFHR